MIKFLRDNIDFIIKLLPLIFGLLSIIRLPIEYYYAKSMQEYFNIPYKYFLIDWRKSLLETIYYAVMLLIFVALNFFMILYRNEYTNVPALFFLFVFINIIYILCTLYCNIEITNVNSFNKNLVISIIVSIFFSLFLVLRVYKPVFFILFTLYFLLSIVFYVFGIINYFKYQIGPNKKFQIIKIGKQMYIVLSDKDNTYILKKINNDFVFKYNDPYTIVNDITNRDIIYHTATQQK